jgi:putative phage-type endonuclease
MLTPPAPGSAAWHALRRTGIGGSDMPAVLGMSKWLTPFGLYQQKIGEIEPEPENERQRWGKLLEPIVRLYYEEATGRQVRDVGFLRHPQHPWLIGNPDGEQLEIKVYASGAGFGEPGTDEVPTDVLIQCHHYLLLTGWPSIDVAVPVYANTPRIYTVDPDPVISEELLARGAAFWERVQRREPPDPVNTEDATRRWGRSLIKGAIEADGPTMDLVASIRARQGAIAAANRLLEDEKLYLMSFIADRGDTLVDAEGRILATWKMGRPRAGYTVAPQAEGSRVLLIKGSKDA